jgi:Ca2+-binding RTX toxin-like protein
MANFVGNSNANTIVGTQGDDSIQARGGNDTVRGQGGNDTIDAGAGNDTARGGPDNDTIAGGTGADRLDGGTGDNILIGGPGGDTFVVDLGTGGQDTNVIADFVDGADRIRLLDNGDPLGSAKIQTARDAADQGDPNAFDDPDPAVQAFTADTPQGSAVNINFGQIPLPIPGIDVLTVVGVDSLGLEVVGNDLFLV